MYVVAQHEIQDQETAFERGARLEVSEGAPEGVRVLQFLPATDRSKVTCLWEAGSVQDIQGYVDGVLGDASINHCYEVAQEPAFAERPIGLATSPLTLR
jgi:hypothetical protein